MHPIYKRINLPGEYWTNQNLVTSRKTWRGRILSRELRQLFHFYAFCCIITTSSENAVADAAKAQRNQERPWQSATKRGATQGTQKLRWRQESSSVSMSISRKKETTMYNNQQGAYHRRIGYPSITKGNHHCCQHKVQSIREPNTAGNIYPLSFTTSISGEGGLLDGSAPSRVEFCLLHLGDTESLLCYAIFGVLGSFLGAL